MYTGPFLPDSFPAAGNSRDRCRLPRGAAYNQNEGAMARKRDTSRPALPGPGGTAYVTPRQVQVLELAAHGLGDKEIATYLGISRRTVEDRFDELRQRTGTRTRVELAVRAAEAGLVQSATDISLTAPVQNPTDQKRLGGQIIGNRSFIEDHSSEQSDGPGSLRKPLHQLRSARRVRRDGYRSGRRVPP